MQEFCTNCGCRLDEDAAFCSLCGAPVQHTDAPDQPVPPASSPASFVAGYAAPAHPRPYGDGYRQADEFPDDAAFDVVMPSARRKKRSKRPLVITLAVIGALLIVGAAVFFLFFNPFAQKDTPASADSTSAPTQAPTQPSLPPQTEPPTDPPTQAPTQAPTQPPTQLPTQAPVSDGGADSIRGVIRTAFDNYYFRSRDAERYLSVILEYQYASSDDSRRAIRERFDEQFADLSELDALQAKFGSGMTIDFTVADVDSLSGQELHETLDVLSDRCDVSGIEEICYVTFTTVVRGSASSEDGLWYGWFYRVGDRWYTDLDFI